MNTRLLSPIGRAVLAAVLLAGMLPPSAASAAPSRADIFSPVVLFAQFAAAVMARNTTYGSVGEFTSDRNAITQANLNTLHDQFKAYVHALLTGDPNAPKINPLRSNQVAAYVMDYSLIKLEQTNTTTFAELEKNKARKQFDQSAMKDLQGAVMGSGLAKQLFGAFSNGLALEQTLINLLSGKIDQLPAVDLQLRQLRSLSDTLREASPLFKGKVVDDLAAKLDNLSAKIRGGLNLDSGDLDDVKGQISLAQSALQKMTASDQLPSLDRETLNNLGLSILGGGKGSVVTQALVGLIANQTGKSYEDVQAEAFAALQAAYKIRCRAKADLIQQSIVELGKQRGVDIVIKPPAALCNEINAEKLFSKMASSPTGPTATFTSTPPTSESGNPDDVPLDDSACACGGYPLLRTFGGGDGISCYYEWTGPSGVKDDLSYTISLYGPQHLNDLSQGSQKSFSDIKGSLADIQPPHVASVFVQDARNFGVVISGPGGISSKTNEAIPLCAHGSGTYLYGTNYMLNTSMFACDLGDKPDGYITAMQTLAQCGMNAIDARYP